MGAACKTNRGDEKCRQHFSREIMPQSDYSETQLRGEVAIIKIILKYE